MVRLEHHEERWPVLGWRQTPTDVADRTWREAMYRLTPVDGSFMIFRGLGSGQSLQMMWDTRGGSPTLWMEQTGSAGLDVTLEQAEEAVAAFVDTGESILEEFGELTRV
ncbi:hypothetical protein [Nocardiopsis lucentensis]|uniref:hypothetical protein n=1 Tax=Nocardiopsis lucentensis TaxID=53441 RepID=UPI000347EEAF|nr:hypothetical protein [Nocardiopsis lucentensis]